MNPKLIALVALCLALLPCARAQGAAPSLDAGPALDATPTPDPAQIELARDVIKSMHADRMFDQMSAQMQRMASQSMNTTNMTPEQKAAAAKVSTQIMALSMDAAKGMLAKMDVIYAEVYSPAELRAMKAFFESPEGVSMLQKQPQVMQKLMPNIQAMQKELTPKIQKIVEDARASSAVAAPAPAPDVTPAKP